MLLISSQLAMLFQGLKLDFFVFISFGIPPKGCLFPPLRKKETRSPLSSRRFVCTAAAFGINQGMFQILIFLFFNYFKKQYVMVTYLSTSTPVNDAHQNLTLSMTPFWSYSRDLQNQALSLTPPHMCLLCQRQ